MGAIISDCGKYRYQLSREWSNSPSSVRWIMLNPSTADATTDDRTISRCIEFSKRWGCGRLYVCNLYAFRATKPADMWKHRKDGGDIIGPDNDYHLVNTPGDITVFACGGNAEPERLRAVYALLDGSTPIRCLVQNADGTPKHPLYVKGDTPLIHWRVPQTTDGGDHG